MTDLLAFFLRTPLSRLGAATTILGGLLLGPLIARRLDWSAPGTVVALWGLGMALVATFVSRIGFFDAGFDLRAANDCIAPISGDWLGPDSLLNFALLVPWGAGLMWASRSEGVALIGVAGLAVAIEVMQSITGLGACERGDLVRNIAGGIVAVALTSIAVRGVTRGAQPRRT